MTARPHDALFKETFSDLANARGELVSVLPATVSALIDWDTLRLEPGTFVDEALRETMTDLLFSVQMCGREARLYLLFEHQSSPHPFMPLRALAYVVRVWEAWLREHEGARRIPPLAALREVRGASDIIAVIRTWARWIRSLSRTHEGRAFLAKLVRYTLLAGHRARASEIVAAMRDIDAEAGDMAKTIAEDLIEEGETKGLAKGRLEGRAEMLLKLLRLRFGAVPESVTERIAHADMDTLDRWAERVLTASSIDEVLAS